MFKTRLISGIVLVLIALITIITGRWLLAGVLLLISLIGVYELLRACLGKGRVSDPLSLVTYLGVIAYYIVMMLTGTGYLLPLAVIPLILIMAVYVFTWPVYRSEQVMTAYFSVVYVAVMLSCIYLTRTLPDGVFTVWLIFICSWGCDTCAYCVGMLIGRHKMSPRLSPKKSIEGAVGGVVGAAALGALYALAIGSHTAAGAAPVLQYAVISAVGALISMIGDLAASTIKRNHEIKDYGKLDRKSTRLNSSHSV